MLAYLCAPLIDGITSRLNRALICAILAVGIVYIFIAAGVSLLPLIKEYMILVANNIPQYYDNLLSFLCNTFPSINCQSEVESLKLEMKKYLDQRVYIIASILGEIASRRETIAGFFSFLLIMPISFFYFLRDWKGMANFLLKCIPHRHRGSILEMTEITRQTFANFFHGQFYVVVILSVYYALLLLILGFSNCICLGILSGLFSFIPFIGALFSCGLIVFMSVPALTLAKFYGILAIYTIGQFVEGYILSPKFVGSRTGLHPLWILFSFYAGIQIGGIIGVLVAIPAAAVIRNWVRFFMRKFRASQAYKQ
jgi:predicted PurR-regulated permease PerM